MKAKRIAAALACVAAGVLAATPGAAAKPGYVVEPERFSLFAKLPKSNGYSVDLSSLGRWVELTVYRRGQIAIYLAKGRVDARGIAVDFGRFGRLRADFTGHRVKSEPIFPGCRGQRPVKERGRLEGSFRFRGEDGYVAVSTSRARASYERTPKQVCFIGTDPPVEKKESVDVLEATGVTEGRKVSFDAFNFAGLDGPFLTASIFERIGRVTVLRLTATTGEGGVLEFSPSTGRPQTVTVEPAFPFRGSALYALHPNGSVEWSGDLRVPLAGLGQVPLTGNGFRADACRNLSPGPLSCKPQPRDAEGSGVLRRLLYGSGSHSQPLALARLSSLR